MIKTNLVVRMSVMLILAIVVSSAQAATVFTDDAIASSSSIIDIPIEMSDASDVGAMDISLTYNPYVLTALGVVNTGDLTLGALVINESTIYIDPVTNNETISEADNQTVLQYGALANHTTTDGVVNISIISRFGFSGAGSVAVVRFEVIGSSGDTSQLDLSTVAAYNVSAPIIGPAGNVTGYESISLTTQNGSVTIFMKGDFNGNSMIDVGDVAKIANLQLGNIPTTPEDIAKGDFNGNSLIDVGDVAKLANYQLGNIGEL